MRGRIAIALLFAGCTGRTPAANLLGAECVGDPANPLRLVCRVDRIPPGPIRLEVADPAGRTQTREAFATTAVFHVWGLHADADVTWTAAAEDDAPITGTVHTGSLPTSLQMQPVIYDPGGSLVDAVLLPWGCTDFSTLAIVDPRGEVLWYQDFHEFLPNGGPIVGFSLTDGGVVALLGNTAVIEVGFDGVLRRLLQYPDPLDRVVHHDAIVVDGDLYVLTAEEALDADGGLYVRDGVDVFDADDARIARWQIGDPLDPTLAVPPPVGYWTGRFPYASDVSHANGLWLKPDGDLLISLRHLDSVVDLHGIFSSDPEIAWVLGGGVEQAALPSDYTWAEGSEGFVLQHNPIWHDDGTLTVLDNRSGEPSRGVRVALDEATHTASIVQEWPAELTCYVQGSAVPIEDGHAVITCAPVRDVREVDADGQLVWRLDPVCINGALFAGPLVRGLPVELDGEDWQ